MGWFRRLTGVSLKSKSRPGSPSPSDPVVDPNAAGPGPSSLAAAALEAFPVSNPESQSPRASGGGRPGHRRTRSREAFGGRDDGIPSVPRSPGFDQSRGHQGFRDDPPHARSPKGSTGRTGSSGPPSLETSARDGAEFSRHNLGLSNLGTQADHRLSTNGPREAGGPERDPQRTRAGHRRTGSRGSMTSAASSGYSDDQRTVRSGFYLAPAPMKPRRWTKGDCLGSGSFGTVYLGLNSETGELFAVKEVAAAAKTANENGANEKGSEAAEQLEQEVELLSRLQHPNIVRYVGISREPRALYIFLEYVPGGSIASLLSRFGAFEEGVIQVYTRQILIGLDYLHSQRCVHRDIKGGNILVEKSGRIKLADFGMAKSLVEQMADSGSFKGSAYWMAPEVIRRSPGGDHPAADVWSVGCTVIEMASGKHPWGDCSGQVQAIFKIASTKELPKVPQSLSPHASEFVLMCLQRDPAARPNSEALLQHPFILGAGDVDVPALQYEGYWSDGYDGDGLGGFDGGSEHGGGISGFTTTDSDASEVDHGAGGHRRSTDSGVHVVPPVPGDDVGMAMHGVRALGLDGAVPPESPAARAIGGGHSRRGSRTSTPDVSRLLHSPPAAPFRVDDWRTEVAAMRGMYGDDADGGGEGGVGAIGGEEEVEFGAGARSMRVRGLLDLPPLPAIGAPSPKRTR